jgi:hypothetical protein
VYVCGFVVRVYVYVYVFVCGVYAYVSVFVCMCGVWSVQLFNGVLLGEVW